MGKMVNDDRIQPNFKMVTVIVKKQPHLCLFALKDILPKSELQFDYGVKSLPWRK
ncbi:hypothetical protein HOLleu_42904 [Holothuria leucospilota]|uniref:SET domain-containing protein n=1 Tax=Holothuria leucospilota TaxID=206669 RepID=A0A9Q1BBX5_HOLLE|nr:hypothetical protein HOLleu_42904 [Holothuria leucospilota]